MYTSVRTSRQTSTSPRVIIAARQFTMRLVTIRINERRSRVSYKTASLSLGVVCGSDQVRSVTCAIESTGNTAFGSSAQRNSFNIENVLYLLINPRPDASL